MHRFTALACIALCGAARAASPAASSCPGYFFLSGNIAANASFETPNPAVAAGTWACWSAGLPAAQLASAADQWTMHTSNNAAPVCSRLVTSTAPGAPVGSRMLEFRAGSNEGGVVWPTNTPAGHAYMVSAWVKVNAGQVALVSGGGNAGPVSWSSKIGEWEQLRVCTNSIGVTNMIGIVNEAPAGGSFLVDRIELREIPIVE